MHPPSFRFLFYIGVWCVTAISASVEKSWSQQRLHPSYTILDWKGSQMLHDFVIQKLHRCYQHRDSLLQEACQHHHIAPYQQHMLQRYLALLGTMPARTALHARVLDTLWESGYRIEKLVFESTPHHHVTANLYIPVGKGPFPGILFCCGHEAAAKATLTYQQTAIRLALQGFVVLVPDPIAQGERVQLTDTTGHPLTRGSTTEHTLLTSGALLVGNSVVKTELWDNIRAIDYLCTRAEVDSSRIGCIGNSGGGTQVAYLIPVDRRIKAAVISSYVTRRERSLALLGPQDGCQWLPGEGKAGLDISDYLIMFAPKPVLILAGRYDFVDFNGTCDVYHELQQVYRLLKAPDHIGLFAYDDGHGIQTPKQLAAVQWFRRWLHPARQPAEVQEPQTLPEAALQVTPTGQVNTSFPDEITLPAQTRSLAEACRLARKAWLHDSARARYQQMLRQKLGLSTSLAPLADTQQMGSFTKDGFHFQKIILRGPGFPPIPCIAGFPESTSPVTRIRIYFSEKGQSFILDNDTLLKRLAAGGYALLTADLRGMGETTDISTQNDPKYMNREYRNAMLSLFVGLPLPGQRVEDVLHVLLFVDQYTPWRQLPVEVDAGGPAAEAALLAAALNNRIHQLNLSNLPHRLTDFLLHSTTPDQLSYVIPDALKNMDFPEIIQFVGPQKIHLQP